MINRRDLIKGSVLLSLSSCVGLKPNFSSLRKEIKGVLENIVSFKTRILYGRKDKPSERILNGEGIVVNDYILTVNHIVSLYTINERMGSMNLRIAINKISEVTTMGDVLEEVVKNRKNDYAIFKLPKDFRRSNYKVRMGDDDKLDILDRLYLVGDAFDLEFIVRPDYLGKREEIRIQGRHDVSIGKVFTGRIVQGDSGSPILNSEGELIGLAAGMNQAYSLFTPINKYKKYLKG